jgi:hypothetical protein
MVNSFPTINGKSMVNPWEKLSKLHGPRSCGGTALAWSLAMEWNSEIYLLGYI